MKRPDADVVRIIRGLSFILTFWRVIWAKTAKRISARSLPVGSSGFTTLWYRFRSMSEHGNPNIQAVCNRQLLFFGCFFFLRANTHSHTNTQRSSSVSVTRDGHGCKGLNKSKDKNGPPSSFVSLNSWMLNLWAAVCSLPLSGSLLLYRHPPVELPHRRMGSHLLSNN